jgi:DNA-cytosine methyltransferase
MKSNTSVLERVRQRISSEKISLPDAAAAIGIGVESLTRHLSGEYARSDSLAKYRFWIDHGNKAIASASISSAKDSALGAMKSARPVPILKAPTTPNLIVDLFCGCGGMSLGFERLKNGKFFRVAMALDIEEPMIRVFNDNHFVKPDALPLARQCDISDFMNEAEIRAYYLDHLARSTLDQSLSSKLQNLGGLSFIGFRKQLRELDALFLENLAAIRTDSSYAQATKALGSSTLNQTSIAGFHNITKLPQTGVSYPKLGPLIWHQDEFLSNTDSRQIISIDQKLARACKDRAQKLWDAEVEKLANRSLGAGRGQLASAAERISRFVNFLATSPMQNARALWVQWRATREALRITFWDDARVQRSLETIYKSQYKVSVLLGGPPCQGFSRIGRGKIRSLREQRVHVQEDETSVDSRNQLMHQYVLFVAALEPDVFLFENVRHFQAVVKAEDAEYDAADVLAEAIENVSGHNIGYAVSKKIVVASAHAVPQNRERFVMSGVRRSQSGPLIGEAAAKWCLALQQRESVSLYAAISDLPEPLFADSHSLREITKPGVQKASAPRTNDPEEIFRDWVQCDSPMDAHVARRPRKDDQAFFALLGPGKRWMDYRSDNSPTLQRLASVLSSVHKAISASPTLEKRLDVSTSEVNQLLALCEGSLSLRLLLETIPPLPGELEHHLLTSNYLNKRDGAHGDWLARMDPLQPSKTVVSHMAKDTYAYVHPFLPRTLSVREAARIQSFPDNYRFGSVGLVDAFRVVGNAVPPLLSNQFAERVAYLLSSPGAVVTVADGR